MNSMKRQHERILKEELPRSLGAQYATGDQCTCPLMPSCNTYHLTWVSLTLDMGYLFTAAPAKHSRCSLPWTRGISSQPPLLTLNLEWLLSALLCPCSHHSLDMGLLLMLIMLDVIITSQLHINQKCHHRYILKNSIIL